MIAERRGHVDVARERAAGLAAAAFWTVRGGVPATTPMGLTLALQYALHAAAAVRAREDRPTTGGFIEIACGYVVLGAGAGALAAWRVVRVAPQKLGER